jgi:hypothetical protein
MWWQSRRTLKAQTRVFLTALGGTSSEVASSLVAAGVSGTPRSAEQCAVAAYLGAIIGSEDGVSSVVVGTHRVFLRLDRGWRPLSLALPGPVREMIRAFDSELYPVLIRRRSDQRHHQAGSKRPSHHARQEATGLQ